MELGVRVTNSLRFDVSSGIELRGTS
jgi:hypothetical protein